MRRFTVTLADTVYSDLEEWADQQNRPLANLAGYLIETGIDEAKKHGQFRSQKSTVLPKTIQQLIHQALADPNRSWSGMTNSTQAFADEAQLELKEVQQILYGDRPTTEQVLAIARIIGVDEIDLLNLVKRQYNGEKKSKTRV